MTEETPLDEVVDDAARIVAGSSYVVALVGAGISVESGIRPFRGPDGIWTERGEPPMDGYQRFLADPATWWSERLADNDSLTDLMRAIEGRKPNPAHHAMAEMERAGFLQHIITQNIDNLHQEAGSQAVTEIHGNRLKLRCITCNARFAVGEIPLDDLPPRCPNCRGIVKTDIVMFGEPIPIDALESCQYQTQLCDCMLLVGTSAVVYPAAEFPIIALRRGARLVEVNPMETPLSDLCGARLRAPAGEALPLLMARLRELKGVGEEWQRGARDGAR